MGFDLIAMLNMPPFFDRAVALLRPGGVVINASSYGPPDSVPHPGWVC
jgi:hypothetical protein